MKEPTKDIELEVEDFGPIAKAKIDLRRLTVFVGPSNTGTSYLAVLIYALHRVFGFTRLARGLRERFPIDRGREDLSEDCIDALLNMANSLADDQGLRDQGRTSLVLPVAAANAFRSRFDTLEYVLSREVGRCFGFDEASVLIRRESESTTSRVVIRRRVCDQADPVEHRMLLAQKCEFSTTVPSGVEIPIDIGVKGGERFSRYLMNSLRYLMNSLEEAKRDDSRRQFAALEVLSLFGDSILTSLVSPLHVPAYYLPADLPADLPDFIHAHSVIASGPAARCSLAADPSTLSEVLADFLEQLIYIDRPPRTRLKAGQDLGKAIEKDILDHSSSRLHGWKNDLALTNVSSMVSELAPVVLYLRHMVEPGNVLIVEEPESHLHPAKQVAFTRQLATLVNAGVRVIITTHSEWLLEELANIVRRSQVSASERGDAGNDGVTLHPEQVGAWLFEPKQRPKGSVVKEIRLDDSGLYPSGYDEVAFKLHNEWADIESRIEDDP